MTSSREVADSRVYAGIHYRTSIDVGVAMGKQIGESTAQKFRKRRIRERDCGPVARVVFYRAL